MPDLKQRLDAVDQVPVDDLWPEIRERFEDEAAGRVTPLRRSDRSGRPEVGWRKALTIAAVFAVLAATGIVLVRSVTSAGVPANPPVEPRPAPLSRAIAYDLDGQIHVADLDGSNPVAITDVGAIDDECPGEVSTFNPSWSPDGRYLAFNRYTDCVDPARHEIVIADLQGNVVESFLAQGREIAWSPDSTRVAVWDVNSYDEGGVGTFTIGIHGIDGTRETLAMPPGWEPYGFQNDPIWNLDGSSLIVAELEVPLDGGTPREIPFHGSFMDRSAGWWTGALAYSPDGSQMAYGTPQGLMVARADGSDPREVSGDGAHTAAWSPNGELIAVASATPGAGWVREPENHGHEQAPSRLRVVDVATGSTTLLVGGEPGTWLVVIGFSPEGDRVLFGEHRPVAGQPEGTYVDALWSIGVDGSDPRQIVAGTSGGVLRPT